MSLPKFVDKLERENRDLRKQLSDLVGAPEPLYDQLGVEFSSTRKLREEFLKRVQMDPDYTPPLSSKKEYYSYSEGSAEEETVESVVDGKGFHSLK